MSPLAGTPEAVELISEGLLGVSGPDRGRGVVFSNNVLEDEDGPNPEPGLLCLAGHVPVDPLLG